MDLMWLVAYEPGVLKAVGRNDGGIVYTKEVVTASSPAKIELLADREVITSEKSDVVHFEINVLDEDNNFVPDASNRINFRVEGAGEIIAVDNGDPLNEESFDSPSRKTFNGKCLVILKSKGNAGEFTLFAESDGLANAQVSIQAR